LILAEVARRQGDAASCRKYLEDASRWVLHSGSVEHLCLWHLERSRLARDDDEAQAAQHAIDEGLHIARQCGLGLYLIELHCSQAELHLAAGDAEAAEHSALEAVRLASADGCRFAWGEAEAGHLLGRAYILQGRHDDARHTLDLALTLRRKIGDPLAEQTERALARIPG
jgi:hypothetical protein